MDHGDVFAEGSFFSEATSVGACRGLDVLTQKHFDVPEVDAFFGGFSCKDVSQIKSFNLHWEDRLEQQDGSTAITPSSSVRLILHKKSRKLQGSRTCRL